MEKVRYAEMLPHEILARRRKFPAAFIGLGGLEWHGEHLAVGNDALKAGKLCELAAARSGGFAFPTLWYGDTRVDAIMETNKKHGAGIRKKMRFRKRKFSPGQYGQTYDEQKEFYGRLLYHVLLQMNQFEMKAVCLVCGHYPIHGWAEPVVKQFNRRVSDTKAYAGIEFHYAPGDERVGGDHAGKWESSYLMYLRPDCADMSVYLGRGGEKLVGVGGIDPRKEASVEVGRSACDLIVSGMVRKAKELVRKAS